MKIKKLFSSTPFIKRSVPKNFNFNKLFLNKENIKSDTVVLNLKQSNYSLPLRVRAFLAIQKPLVRLFGGSSSNVRFYNIKSLEGLQEGINIFDGLSLKQIAFIGEDFHSIATRQGCYSNCAHCYPEAKKPFREKGDIISNALFEDFKAVADGYKELKKRSGINFVYNNNPHSKYHSYVFDADNIDIALKDRSGKIHDFPELNRIFYQATGQKGIFDTSGWTTKSKVMQQRAEKLVEYYSKAENMDELLQFNVSINPFHSIYMKSVEYKEKGELEKAKAMYDIYTDRISNALLTFYPLAKHENFGVIVRAFSNKIPNMGDFNVKDTENLLKDIFKKLMSQALKDFNSSKKYMKTQKDLGNLGEVFSEKLNFIDTHLVLSERLKNLLMKRNPELSEFDFFRMFPMPDFYQERYEQLKRDKNVSSVGMKYLKIIDVTGKVYLSDSYRVIPTDMQLNYINKDKLADSFHPMVDDFKFTKRMI